MINMIGVGLMWPILPILVQELTGGSVAEIAALYGVTAVVFSGMQFLFAPLMGALSDRYGRKPVMLIALAALGMDNILLAFAPTIGWMIFARAMGGGFAATFSIANAYVADVTEPDKRAAGFGLIGAAFGVGFIIGPLIGGVLGEIDIRYPFFFAAALSFINVLVGLRFLKETLPPEKREANNLWHANPFSTIGWIFSRKGLAILAAIIFFANIMQRGLEAMWVLFTQIQYGWGIREAGYSLAVVGISFFVVQGILVGRVVGWLGEVRTMIIGFCLSAAMYLVLAFNPYGWLAYCGIIPHVLGIGCAVPALQALASKQVEQSQQGYLQGSFTGLAGLSAIIGPAASTATLSLFTSTAVPIYFPGAFFLFGSVMLLVCATMSSQARQPA